MAQPGSPTRGFGGRVLYVNEVTEGTTPANPLFKKFSDHVQSVSVSIDPDAQEYRDIGDFDVASFVAGLPSYGLKLSFLLHVNRGEPASQAIDRLASNALQSHTIEVAVNLDGASQGYFTFTGAKAESVEVKGEVGKAVMVEVTYKALLCTVAAAAPSIGSGSRESAALGALSTFATSTIRRNAAALAFITRKASLKVAHKLTVEGTDGQSGPKYISEGGRSIKGSVDMSIDDAGVTLAGVVAALTGADIVFNLGPTGAPMYTATAAIFDNFEFEMNTSDGYVAKAVPFTAKKLTVATVP